MPLRYLATVTGTFEERIYKATGLNVNEFQTKLNFKPSKKIVQVSIHNKCFQNCIHCFQIESPPSEKVNLENLSRHLDMFDSKIYRKYPFPREPLLLEKILPLYKRYDCNEISTSAYLISDKPSIIQNLKKSGIETVFVSLHGNKDQHLTLTNATSGNYEKLIDSIKRLVDSSISVEIITTLSKSNLEAIDYLPEQLINIGVFKWWIQRIIPCGKVKKWRIKDLIYGDECQEVMLKYSDLRSKYSSRQLNIGLDQTWGPNFYSEKMLRFLSGQDERWPWSRSICPAANGDSIVVSNESGKYYPCLFFETFQDAQIKYINGKIDNTFFDAASLNNNLDGICKNCLYKSFCLGGCRAIAFSFANLRGKKNPIFAGQDYCLSHALDKEFAQFKE